MLTRALPFPAGHSCCEALLVDARGSWVYASDRSPLHFLRPWRGQCSGIRGRCCVQRRLKVDAMVPRRASMMTDGGAALSHPQTPRLIVESHHGSRYLGFSVYKDMTGA
jgi:hypothetical protein